MKRTLGIMMLLGLVISGCRKDFITSLTDNPNSPTTASATPPLILPGIITGLGDIVNGTNVSGGYQSQGAWLGYWNYSGGFSFNQPIQEYVMTNTSPQVWDQYYTILTNVRIIEQQAAEDPLYSTYGAYAQVIEALCFKGLVDVYDAVPYSKALQGAGNFFPTYDNGSDIYDSLFVKLDAAIATLQANNGNAAVNLPASDDVLFAGDLGLWAKFANTVKLKLAIQESEVASKLAMIKSELAATSAVGYLGLGEDAIANPGYSSAKQGPFYGSFGVSPAGALNGSFNYLRSNGTAIAFYKASNDPRLSYFYSRPGDQPLDPDFYTDSLPAGKSAYQGDVLGIQTTQLTKGSGIGPGIVKTSSDGAPILTAAESFFLQSEAALRGYFGSANAALAKTDYQNAIMGSFEYLGIPDADNAATTYYSQTGVTNVSWPATFNTQLSAILTQKWAALNGINNVEGYNDWRRTFAKYGAPANSGYPVVPVSISPTNTRAHMPFRYYYPLEEPNSNADAWNAAGGPNVDPFTSKIWWMQ